jgi:hypothetical protein
MSATRRLHGSLLGFICFVVGSPAFAGVAELGQVNVASSTRANVLIPLTSAQLALNPVASVHYGIHFAATPCTATATGCQVSVTFSPKAPGSLTDAIVLKDASGNLLSRTILHGTGLGPRAVFNPAMVSVKVASQSTDIVRGLAFDQAGRLFYTDDQYLYRLDPGSNAPVVLVTAPNINTMGPPAIDPAGNIFYFYNGVLQKIDADTGLVNTIPGASGALVNPLAFDTAGNIFITGQNTVQRIDAATGTASIVAGGGSAQMSAGDGGPATSATLWAPRTIAVNSNGDLFIAQGDSRIRKVDAATQIIQTIAGTGTGGYSGDGGPATQAKIGDPAAMTLDAFGNIYLADNNSVVRKINAVTQIISTVAGSRTGTGIEGGALSSAMQFYDVSGIAFDSAGNLFLSIFDAYGIVEINFAGTSLPFNWPGSLGPASVIDESIVNFGNQPLTITSASVTSPFTLAAAANSSFCTFPVTLAAQSACQVALTYQYSSSTENGTLTVNDNSLNQSKAQQQITLQLVYPQANLSLTAINFGQGVVGGFGNQWVTIANPTNAPLLLSSITINGPNAVDFSDDAATSGECKSSIAAQSSCLLDVYYEPKSAGSKSATVVITTNALNSPETIALSASAINPAKLVASASLLDFGLHSPGSTSVQTLTLTNTGDLSLTFNIPPALTPSFGFTQTANTCGTSVAGGASCAISITFSPTTNGTYYGYFYAYWQGSGSSFNPIQVEITGTTDPKIKQLFVPVTPCRIADTRYATGPFGGPMLTAGSTRDFIIPNSACGIPSTAQAYALNVTVVPPGGLSYLTLWPTGASQPNVSTMNSDGRVKATAAIVTAGSSGGVSVYVTDATDVVLDVSGYFVPATQNTALAFYPLTPCRVLDTRIAAQGPALGYEETRTVAVTGSSCNVPATAQAYSLNLTVVPATALSYLTAWPAGQKKPLASNLNATHDVTANAAIVPAGSNGAIAVYATDATDLVVDINGYFAPPTTGGLSFYGVTPCRILDSRLASGYNGPTTGSGSAYIGYCGVAPNSQAVVLNATAVPVEPLGYLTLWNGSQTRPLVSTLNSGGAITSNLAIVPTLNNYIGFYASNPTYLVLDVNGYFAP